MSKSPQCRHAAADEDEEETSKAAMQAVREDQEEITEVSSVLARLQEEVEAERSLWNQEKLKLQESLRAATQAAGEEKEAGKKTKEKSVFKRFRKFLCCSGTI
ncbi:unnamed protein product [Pleuronectes platessa]|uniref:Uncharacterized protein n=1 Tax=Pleuronectes platessa TaxID=8262 RepID=A0A9N7VKE9_PLEPL|nr:unnamed protein product [Pleuronectes platessa]